MKVFLTGFMGAGKTTVGKALALRLGLPFVDLDAEIEAAAGRSIREIFERDGEVGFRRLEHRTLAALLEQAAGQDLVLATGGGTVTREECRRLLREHGTAVWLDLPFAAVVERVTGPGREERPLFRDEARARELYEARRAVYRQCGLRVEVAPQDPPEALAARIADRLADPSRGGPAKGPAKGVAP